LEQSLAQIAWEFRTGNESAARLANSFSRVTQSLEDWLTAAAAILVKEGPHRKVYRLNWLGLDLHLKHYVGGDSHSWIRRRLPSPAQREFRIGVRLLERKVPTLDVLGFGEAISRRGNRSSFLITRTLPRSTALEEFLEVNGRGRPRLRQKLAHALGLFLARLHEAGVQQEDLHPGNLLVRWDAEIPEFFLIDLPAVRVGRPLRWSGRRQNLVVLNRWFILRSTRSDRLRAWRAYESAYSPTLAAGVPQDLEARTLASNLAFWRQADRRCLNTNRYFRVIHRGAFLGHAVSDLPKGALEELLASPDDLFQEAEATILKHSASSTIIRRKLATADGGRPVILKKFAVTRWSDPWVALLRPNGAMRSWVMGHGLRLRGLPTPRPLAIWHRVEKGLRQEAYLLTEEVPTAMDLRSYLVSLAPLSSHASRRKLRALIEETAQTIRLLHSRRLSHRDLKAANLLVSPANWKLSAKGIKEVGQEADSKEASPLRLWFIDLVGVRRHSHLGRKRMLQNLTRLHVSFQTDPNLRRTDKLRFLRSYLPWAMGGRQEWKRWWRAIEASTRNKIERNMRKGRPLG
jgi:tRNA A-37 threonylcarbamoyl transferase component Bud32